MVGRGALDATIEVRILASEQSKYGERNKGRRMLGAKSHPDNQTRTCLPIIRKKTNL